MHVCVGIMHVCGGDRRKGDGGGGGGGWLMEGGGAKYYKINWSTLLTLSPLKEKNIFVSMAI